MRNNKIRELVQILEKFNISDVMRIEERYDPQYNALKYLYDHMKDKGYYLLLIILNSIVSYQLTGTGEQYWWEFAKYFSKKELRNNIIDTIIEFLKVSKLNARLRMVKINRIIKLRDFALTFQRNLAHYITAPLELVKDLARSLNAKENAKTIVFAAKMFHYGCRIAGLTNLPLPYGIPIPVDKRIMYISNKLGIHNNIQGFWNKIAKETRIPPLHIDSLIWVSLGYIRRGEKVNEKRLQELINTLKRIISD